MLDEARPWVVPEPPDAHEPRAEKTTEQVFIVKREEVALREAQSQYAEPHS